jgi:CheY-like chemotaxis protein
VRVLLIDADGERSKALAGACTARGHAVERAPHGAAALELALGQVPDVIVCPVDLPIIDGARLAQILRSNPRTRSVSFVFLVEDELDAPLSMDLRDRILVSPWREEEVTEQLDAILEREASSGGLRTDAEVEGKLSQISLADLLQIFHVNRKSGTIRIHREDLAGTPAIYLRHGQVVDATIPVGEGNQIVGEKAIFRLLAWEEGRFDFVPGVGSPGTRIQRPTRALLLEGLRQIDEWRHLRRELPGEEARLSLLQARPEVGENANPLTREVLGAVATWSRVGAVVDHCPYPDYQVLRAIHDLIIRGVLQTEAAPESALAGGRASRSAIFTPVQTRRLREWIASQRPRPGPVVKMLVIAPGRGAVDQFLPALRECDDFSTDGRLVREPGRAGRLAPLGQFSLTGGLSVRLLAVPPDDTYRPLARMAAHGMLGALRLLPLPLATGLEATQGVVAAVRTVSSRPVVPVVQAGADEVTLPAELNRELGGEDGGPAYLLPAEPAAERLATLQNVFARLVP